MRAALTEVEAAADGAVGLEEKDPGIAGTIGVHAPSDSQLCSAVPVQVGQGGEGGGEHAASRDGLDALARLDAPVRGDVDGCVDGCWPAACREGEAVKSSNRGEEWRQLARQLHAGVHKEEQDGALNSGSIRARDVIVEVCARAHREREPGAALAVKARQSCDGLPKVLVRVQVG